MRCTEFEAHVTDLTRHSVMDAAIRNEALCHANECLRCGSMLADHISLSAGLRALAVTDRAIQPAVSVEDSLLRAFREKKPGSIPTRTRAPWVVLTAAAVLLAVFGITSFLMSDAGKPTARPSSRVSGADLAISTPPARLSPSPEVPEVSKRKLSMAPVKKPLQPAVSHQRSFIKTSYKTGTGPGPVVEERLSGHEITTDFIPLSYGAEYIPIESGQIIRVKMARSALISFGFPMSQERIDEQVKADILVSNDGLAHAIRFVQ